MIKTVMKTGSRMISSRSEKYKFRVLCLTKVEIHLLIANNSFMGCIHKMHDMSNRN